MFALLTARHQPVWSARLKTLPSALSVFLVTLSMQLLQDVSYALVLLSVSPASILTLRSVPLVWLVST